MSENDNNIKPLIAVDSFLYRTPDGKYWAESIYDYGFFTRYLKVFKNIIIASRCSEACYEDVKGFVRADGPGLEIRELPPMRGMSSYITNIFSFLRCCFKACEGVQCAILRLPSVAASMIMLFVKIKRIPIALEVVADPYGAYEGNFLAQLLFSCNLKYACRSCEGVSYVTEKFLQSIYPSKIEKGQGRFESFFSTIDLNNDFFYKHRLYYNKKHFRIIHVANNMNNDIKGHEVLIRASKILIENNYSIHVTFVGDGYLKDYLKNLTISLGIEKYFSFRGMLSSKDLVRKELINSDIFVLPTKSEGLPRVIIEAMAVGLPCISSPVSGIPELLEKDDLVDPKDISALAKKIEDFFLDTDLLTRKSKRNINKAKEYLNTSLNAKRTEFYTNLLMMCKKG